MTSLSQADMAAKLALSPSALSNKLRLLRLGSAERRLIEQNDLGERHARAFLKIRDEALRKKAILQVITDGLSAAETEQLADRLNTRQTAFGEEEPAEVSQLPDQQTALGEKEHAKPNACTTEKTPARADPKKPRQRICLIRDVRFFFNTLDRALSLLEEAGFSAGQNRTETEEGYEVRLFIPKSASKAEIGS